MRRIILLRVLSSVPRKILLITLLLSITGGQWMLLQSAAWAGMLVRHLQSESISSSISNTFDGQHPCKLCKAIESGKRQEKKSDFEIKLVKFEFPMVDRVADSVDLSRSRAALNRSDVVWNSLTYPPATPPPRGLPA